MASEQVKPRIYSENSGYLLGAGTLTQMGNFLSKGCICVVVLIGSDCFDVTGLSTAFYFCFS